MIFWVVTLCSDVVGYQQFGGPCCLDLQGELKAAKSSETWLSYHITTQYHNPENFDLYHHCENLKCHSITLDLLHGICNVILETCGRTSFRNLVKYN